MKNPITYSSIAIPKGNDNIILYKLIMIAIVSFTTSVLYVHITKEKQIIKKTTYLN